MILPQFPNKLILPPPGRPRWLTPGSDLHYLGWGRRYYGTATIPVTRHTGWPYLVILRGSPLLVLADSPVQLKAGDVFVMHPDCPSGWNDREEAECEILSWIWQTPPDETISPLIGQFLLGRSNPDHLERLKRLHSECRREVGLSDQWSTRSVAAIRRQLDAEFGRVLNGKGEKSHRALQFELAGRWMRENLSTRNPISCLCEYLDVSPSRLYQLFIEKSGCSPAGYHHRLRMEYAHELIAIRGFSAKETAHTLGYRHPNDFSRAFKGFFKMGTRGCREMLRPSGSHAPSVMGRPGT